MTASADRPGSGGSIKPTWRTPMMFIAPAALLIFATVLTPIVMSFWISLHEWSLLTPITEMEWVGFDNYEAIFSGLLLSLIPILLIYLVFQKMFVRSAVAGAVKG